MEGQHIQGLGDQGEQAQPGQVALDVMGVQQAHRHAVAEQGERQPPHPPEQGDLGEKDAAHMVQQHGTDGDEFEEIGIQIGLQFCLRHVAYSLSCFLAPA